MAQTNIQNVPTLKKLCDTLIDACGATYIAAAEQTLALASPVVYLHAPTGQGQERSTREVLHDRLDGAEVIRHGAQTMRFDLRHVNYTDVHTFGRVPLYAVKQHGLENVSLQEGIKTAEKYLTGEIEVTRPPSDIIELEELVSRFAAEGAVAVELRNRALTESEVINLRVLMSPATGHDLAGPYTHVTVDNEEYPLCVDFALDGPGRYGTMCTPLYLSQSVGETGPVKASEGISYFKKVASITTTADDAAEVSEEIRKLDFGASPE